MGKVIPAVDYTEPMANLPLVMVQVTRFACGGVCVGVANSNVVADGISGTLFVDAWAKLARGRTLGEDEKPLFLDKMVIRRSEGTTADEKFFSASRFEHREFKTLPVIIGRYESVAAYIWRCACKARNADHNQPTVVRTVAGTRNRLKPPLPPNYFGNATHPTVTPKCLSGDIASKPLRCGCVEAPFLGNPNLSIWSWMTDMPIYGADFGWGRPIYMGPGELKGDGRTYIMPAPSGDVTLSVAIRLQKPHVQPFVKFFYQDI
ncbi:hypothetical protein PIB30_026937 [Stylosanthes scabra]|uniref:Shikimate O-hydroxycinnamoyltransferase n=1 Tax=Stylosanthes scabra TaxID=79078 RepID=A0ABU6Y7W5_9FABA|nr:hypothetical protein [Stylosanthes scabra]